MTRMITGERYLHCPIWFCLPSEIQEKLKTLNRPDWKIPSPPIEIESVSEIDHLMRQPPQHTRRQASW